MLSPSHPFPSPDHMSFPFFLSSLSSSPCHPLGPQLHSLLLKYSLFPSDHYVISSLLRFYCLSLSPSSAHRLFDEIWHADPVHFNILMCAYIRANQPLAALSLFDQMLSSQIVPDDFVITTTLTACAHAGFIDKGLSVHRYIENRNRDYLRDSFIGSALVNMYAKCGCIEEATRVFMAMPERNTHMWAVMVGALAMHGFAREAVECLHRMGKMDGVRPDGVVVLGVMSACAHAGLVDEGMTLLHDLEKGKFSIVPNHEHYSCTVDMLCRVGRLEDAVKLIRRMPMRPLASVWGALLAGCRMYKNVEFAEMAVMEMQRLTEGKADDEGVYVQLSNIYLDANRADDARRVRKIIGSRGVKKETAFSSVEIEGEVSSFVAGDQAHHQNEEICALLDILADEMQPKASTELLAGVFDPR